MHSVTVDGIALEYESRGSGEPVALIHLSLCADSFAPLMDEPELAGYRLVRYHRRGYVGSSRTAGTVTIADQAADLVGLLDHVGMRRAHIVGHSYGGLIALQLALDRPDLVGSLVLMEPALRVRSGGPASQEPWSISTGSCLAPGHFQAPIVDFAMLVHAQSIQFGQLLARLLDHPDGSVIGIDAITHQKERAALPRYETMALQLRQLAQHARLMRTVSIIVIGLSAARSNRKKIFTR